MLGIKRLASRRILFVLTFGGLTATAAGAGTLHRFAVSQGTGSGSLGSTAFLNTSSSGGAVQAQVGGSTLTSFTYPFGLFGLYNSSGIGFGTVGLSTTSYGVAGQSTSKYASVFGLSGGDGAAVEGMNPDTSSTAAPAGYFSAAGGTGIIASSTSGTGIQASSGADGGIALTATAASSGTGIVAKGGTTGLRLCDGYYETGVCAEGQFDGAAFFGGEEDPTGLGVEGTSVACQSSQNGCTPYGLNMYPVSIGAGAAGYAQSGPGIYGDSAYDYGVFAENNGNVATLEVKNDAGTGSDPAVEVIDNATGKETVADASGNFYTSGFVESGSDQFLARPRNPQGDVMTYATQQAEATVEDVGTARLINGSAAVALAADFRQTINADARYLVFITPAGDTKGLYVASRTSAGFTVRETQGGRGTLDFDYRIVAQPYGSLHARLPHLHDLITLPHHPARRSASSTARFGLGNENYAARKASLARLQRPLYNPPPVPPGMFKLSNFRGH